LGTESWFLNLGKKEERTENGGVYGIACSGKVRIVLSFGMQEEKRGGGEKGGKKEDQKKDY